MNVLSHKTKGVEGGVLGALSAAFSGALSFSGLRSAQCLRYDSLPWKILNLGILVILFFLGTFLGAFSISSNDESGLGI